MTWQVPKSLLFLLPTGSLSSGESRSSASRSCREVVEVAVED